LFSAFLKVKFEPFIIAEGEMIKNSALFKSAVFDI